MKETEKSLLNKEEKMMNENTNNNIVDNPEPDWSLGMFWEDITHILKKIGELIEELIKALSGSAE